MNNGMAVCSRPNSHVAGSHDQTDWVEGRDFRVDHSRIQDFCAKPLTDLEQDLALLTAVVAFSDRLFARHRGSALPQLPRGVARIQGAVPPGELDSPV